MSLLVRDGTLRRPGHLGAILALTLIRGLFYLALLPPWQHYDEPSHFEYVRLIAERGKLPREGEYDLAMRREIAASMVAAGFWQGSAAPVIDLESDLPPSIGVSELYHPLLYYLLLAGPQLLVAHHSVEMQLYLARLGSVFFSLVLVASAYGLVADLFPSRPWLPVFVAGFIALLPPLTDLMSSVNNDTAAAAAVSLLLWASIRLLKDGVTWRRVAAVLLLAGVCVAVKSTAGAVAVAVLVVLLVGYLWPLRPFRLWRWLALLVPVVALGTCTWGSQAACWHSQDPAAAANRRAAESPLGHSALVLSSRDRRYPIAVRQELELPVGQGLRGHTITAGAWLRAAQRAEGTVRLGLSAGSEPQWFTFEVTSEWAFHAITTEVALDAPGVGLQVALPAREQAATEIYLDGLVLVDGVMPVDLAPVFDTERAEKGRWGTRQFNNLLRNGSAEDIWPGLRPWIGNREVFREPVSSLFHSVWDWHRTGWVYRPEIGLLFQSFWGRFGWNHLALPSGYFYPLGLATLGGIVGAGLWLVQRLRTGRAVGSWRRQAAAVLLIAWLLAWGGSLLRIHPIFVTEHVHWPVARYATTAIVPTALLLCLGWAQLVPRRWVPIAAWLGLLGLVVLDVAAVWLVIVPYYYG